MLIFITEKSFWRLDADKMFMFISFLLSLSSLHILANPVLCLGHVLVITSLWKVWYNNLLITLLVQELPHIHAHIGNKNTNTELLAWPCISFIFVCRSSWRRSTIKVKLCCQFLTRIPTGYGYCPAPNRIGDNCPAAIEPVPPSTSLLVMIFTDLSKLDTEFLAPLLNIRYYIS